MLPEFDIAEHAVMDPKQMEAMHPVDVLHETDKVTKAIDKHTLACKNKLKPKKGQRPNMILWQQMWAEVFEQFGQWSHLINRAVRFNIAMLRDTKDEKEIELLRKYKWVYAYWWNRYALIHDKFSKYSRWKPDKVTQKIERARDTLAKLIRGEISPETVHARFMQIVEQLNGRAEHDKEIQRASRKLSPAIKKELPDDGIN